MLESLIFINNESITNMKKPVNATCFPIYNDSFLQLYL